MGLFLMMVLNLNDVFSLLKGLFPSFFNLLPFLNILELILLLAYGLTFMSGLHLVFKAVLIFELNTFAFLYIRIYSHVGVPSFED
jgi:hypothetical protein